MDIAKYISLFLLKNHFCYLPGVGNLELRRRPASYENSYLAPGFYEVFITSAETIDDSLANFIAANEQVTISKATTALREFCIHAKNNLQHGGELLIPAVGKLMEEYGRLIFIPTKEFSYNPLPVKVDKREIYTVPPQQDAGYYPAYNEPAMPAAEYHEEPPYEEKRYPENNPSEYSSKERSGRSHHHHDEPSYAEGGINWKKVIWTVLILISVLVGAIFGVRLLSTDNEYSQADRRMPVIVDSTLLKAKVDSMAKMAAQTTDSNTFKQYRFVLEAFPNRTTADKRAEQMRSYGHNVEVVMKDTTEFDLILPVRCRPSDTSIMLDSLSRNFNPAGVSIMY